MCPFVLKVAIVAQDLAAFHSASSEMGHQQHGHHLVTTETRPVTLLATSNGTQIAVQVRWGEMVFLECFLLVELETT